ncbi:MAG: hypothetical protein RLY86_823 [Pseudomonadota bacterium]|jgi:AcrR family transcriptional regulator
MGNADKDKGGSGRPRDRAATERSLVEAAKQVLAEEGFQGFGVNAIARRAACDKQLIYRYFGGLEGLADAVGTDLAGKLADDLTPLSTARPPTTYGELIKLFMHGLIDLLRGDPILRQIVTWEVAAPSPLLTRLSEARGKRLALWMHERRGTLVPPDGVDAPAVNAVLIASVQHLVLSAAASGGFAGLSLTGEADWQRVHQALGMLADGIYGTDQGGSGAPV